jgi:hypothetical protein
MARHYRYISADGHFESPPEQWTHRVPKQCRGSVKASQLVISGVFDRFPSLQIYWAENNVG